MGGLGTRKKAVAAAGAPQGQKAPRWPPQVAAWLTKDTGRSIKTVASAQLQAGSTLVSSTAGFELLCTYNWVSTSAPTIYVPGGPARWNPVALPVALPKDSGPYFIDQN